MVFNTKMEEFRQKARLLAEGHKTKVITTITYGSVVVRIALMIATLNDLEVTLATS